MLVIDFLLFTFLLIGSRVSFAALNDTFARLQSRWQPRVLIVGAGDLGELVLRSIIRSRPAAYRPVGFLDPDPATRNRTAAQRARAGHARRPGARVTGQHDVDLVVLALAPVYAELAERLRERCEALGVPAFARGDVRRDALRGLPVLPAPSWRHSGWRDPGGTPSR